ncbi:hypothetical protein E1956_44915 (plasmid) [Paraburkholderia pallida]|uniref:Uncharacterized protein n=1 Tax=Paraburkholderia pallida TaxID=2547399 RepID=A0A4P7D671_9BURK|nr:hypothetical protein E1956_44915 [Paraburkholderia pallida]
MATRIVAYWSHCATKANLHTLAVAAALLARPMLRRVLSMDRPIGVSGRASKTSKDPAPNTSGSPRRHLTTIPPLPLYGFGSRP